MRAVPPPGGLRRRALLRGVPAFAVVWAVGAMPKRLLAQEPEAPQWRLDRTPEALYLNARIPLELPSSLAEALYRGVPLHFVWRAELRRPRWYWTDQQLAVVVRTVRLVYQPLTQRWRLSVHEGAPAEDSAHTGALHRNLDTLEEALALARAVSRWRVAPTAGLDGDERLEASFRLDTGQLPRPLQILPGFAGDSPLVWRSVLRMPPAAGDAGAAPEVRE